MKSLVHTKELCSRSVPLEHAPRAKSLVCIGLKAHTNYHHLIDKTRFYVKVVKLLAKDKPQF